MSKVVVDYLLSRPFSYQEYARREYGIELHEKWMGSDEVGKGDYFGPLVVACVCTNIQEAELLYRYGLSDSKTLSQGEISRFETMIRELVGPSHMETVMISPAKYNQLHERMGNVNSILAWAHGRAISEVAGRSGASQALVDRFSSGHVRVSVQGVQVHEFVRGERDMAVAAASVIASAAFDRELRRLSKLSGFRLPRGGGKEAAQTAKSILSEKGSDYFRTIGKADFRL